MEKTVLSILESNQGQYISGQKIGEALHMTRANVWKEIEKLRKEGYHIDSIRNKGYCLLSRNNNLSRSMIRSYLNENTVSDIEILDAIDSTNNYAKKIAQDESIDNYCIITDHQTKGRGRRGRSFYSPDKNGIYLSLILRPQLKVEDAQLITIIAALAVVDAIESCYGIQTDIKWLNDIYLDQKKLAGILTEGEIILENTSYRYLVVGIGINIFYDNNLPEALKDIYTALEVAVGQDLDRDYLAGEIINHFYAYYRKLETDKEAIINQYKTYCFILGQEISIKGKDGKYIARDIDSRGHLIVEDKTGTLQALNSGEISIGGFINEN
ncbi:MAG TPA: biotin--[acetyl-CoA-carboxylase] ligase [Erysipelothrix sp.]